MDCPHCHSTRVSILQRQTNLGYAMFRCKICRRTFNERTGNPFNFIEIPTDILFQVLLYRIRYKLSYRDVAEFFLIRGFQFSHETVRAHEVRPCTANPVEQSHRRIKHRYYPALGFGEFEAAQRFCRAVDEVSNFSRPRSQLAEFVSLSDRRERFLKGVEELEALFQFA